MWNDDFGMSCIVKEINLAKRYDGWSHGNGYVVWNLLVALWRFLWW